MAAFGGNFNDDLSAIFSAEDGVTLVADADIVTDSEEDVVMGDIADGAWFGDEIPVEAGGGQLRVPSFGSYRPPSLNSLNPQRVTVANTQLNRGSRDDAARASSKKPSARSLPVKHNLWVELRMLLPQEKRQNTAPKKQLQNSWTQSENVCSTISPRKGGSKKYPIKWRISKSFYNKTPVSRYRGGEHIYLQLLMNL